MTRKPRLSLDAKIFRERERERELLRAEMMESLKFGFVVGVFCRERLKF